MNIIMILIVYIIYTILTGYYFYLVGFNEASELWLKALRENDGLSVAKVLEIIEKAGKEGAK